eukprot:TRINITY_DN459_c0_g1_i3.p2 TRINITY_DN459_c0_g1~~TRINITY_DN459_c0_g1_i3.p2  ORF type:complete len:287 (+),score=40.16 TRINITY_DN459_c0_g1_i3:25-885(+)
MAIVAMPTEGSTAARAPLGQSITLPDHLRGYVKYLVVLNPLDCRTYSLGIKHVCPTEGAREVLQRLSDKRERKHRKSLQAGLCLSLLQGFVCPYGVTCAAIHCTPEGLSALRPWSQLPPAKAPPATPSVPHVVKPPQGSSSPASSLGDHSRASSVISEEVAPDVGSVVPSAERLFVGRSPPRDGAPSGRSTSRDGNYSAPTNTLPAALTLLQSLARLRQRSQQFESAPRTHQLDPSVPCIVVHASPTTPSDSVGTPTPRRSWADELESESVGSEGAIWHGSEPAAY